MKNFFSVMELSTLVSLRFSNKEITTKKIWVAPTVECIEFQNTAGGGAPLIEDSSGGSGYIS